MANNRRGGFLFSGGGSGGGFTSSLLSGGKPIFFLFLAVVIGGAFLLGGGNPFPKNQLTVPEEGVYEIDEESLRELDDARGNLQLRTIRFKECAATTAVTLQLDITGSMRGSIGSLKNAVYTFTDQLSDDSVIGIQAYNEYNSRIEVIPVSLFKDVRDQIRPRVGGLVADGSTPTYDALIYSGEVLRDAIPQFPERQFTFIFFSDGNPNIGPSTQADIAQAAGIIKDMGVTVYSIGLGSVNPSIIGAVASSPDKAIIAASSADLERIYSEIAQRLCNSVGTSEQ